MPKVMPAIARCIVIVVLLLALAACGQQVEQYEAKSGEKETVIVHGGAENGFYNDLIDDRLNDAKVGIPYHFVACVTGGSLDNLVGLGMTVREGATVEDSKDDSSTPDADCTDTTDAVAEFGLVQNYWIYAATEVTCDPDDGNQSD